MVKCYAHPQCRGAGRSMVLHELNALLIPHWNPYPLGVVNGQWAGDGEVRGDGKSIGWRMVVGR